MRTICSAKEAEAAEIRKAINIGIARAQGSERRKLKAKLYMAGIHLYERIVDNQRTGETKEMHGTEAMEINEALLQQFIDSVRSATQGERIQRIQWAVIQRDLRPTVAQQQIIEQALADRDHAERKRKEAIRNARNDRAERAMAKAERAHLQEQNIVPA